MLSLIIYEHIHLTLQHIRFLAFQQRSRKLICSKELLLIDIIKNLAHLSCPLTFAFYWFLHTCTLLLPSPVLTLFTVPSCHQPRPCSAASDQAMVLKYTVCVYLFAGCLLPSCLTPMSYHTIYHQWTELWACPWSSLWSELVVSRYVFKLMYSCSALCCLYHLCFSQPMCALTEFSSHPACSPAALFPICSHLFNAVSDCLALCLLCCYV